MYPREIEDVISGCAGVSAVAVIGVPDDRWGEAATAFVAARPGEHLDLDEIRKTVRERKGARQTPKAIHIMDELPKTQAGKIDKKALRRPYLGRGYAPDPLRVRVAGAGAAARSRPAGGP